MKKIILFLFIALCPLFVQAAGVGISGSGVGGMPSSPVFAGTVSSTKACAAGFTRIGPNFCLINSEGAQTALVRDTCTSITSPSADAKALYLQLRVEARTNNAIAARFTSLVGYDAAGCTTVRTQWYTRGYEEVAKVAGTELQTVQGYVILPNPTNTPYLQFTDDTGNQGVGWYHISGYLD